MKTNRTCLLCGAEYYYCPCDEEDKPGWLLAYDSKECKDVFETLIKYKKGNITALEAKEMIKNIDISSIHILDKNKTLLNEVLNYEESTIKISPK